jgi:acetolactate synthase-1/2/3 large subunit
VTEGIRPRNVGEAILLRLKKLGVDYFFANPGTEFVSVIRGFRDLPKEHVPKPILAPHEFTAVSMAYGAYLANGRAQAVMTHANVGAANALIGLIGAFRMNIPLIFISGMTSHSERQCLGHRDKLIHWAQESRDQAGMFREYVKWEIEIRDPSVVYDVLDRAMAIAMTEPRGPVAVSISRDLLVDEELLQAPETIQVRPAASPLPAHADLETFFKRLAVAERPLVITNRLGAEKDAVRALLKISEQHALGVVTPDDYYMSFPGTHENHLGYRHGKSLDEADLVLVLDTEVPWYPVEKGPRVDAFVAHVGIDPLFKTLPLRSHRGDLFIQCGVKGFLEAVQKIETAPEVLLSKRRSWIRACQRPLSTVSKRLSSALSAESLSAVLSEFLDSDTVLINELGLEPAALSLTEPGTYFRSGSASPLGWGMGCGLGYAMADPDRVPIITVGDGVFYLSHVLGSLLVAQEQGLPILLLVLDNGGMRSIGKAVEPFYPDCHGELPLLGQGRPAVALEKIAEIYGGIGLRADSIPSLSSALDSAMVCLREKRQSVVIHALLSS